MSINTFTKTHNDKVIKLTCHAALKNQAEFMLDLIAREDLQYNVLKSGFKMQIGWSLYFIDALDGEYVLKAPDFYGNPFEQTSTDLTLPLTVQMRQNDVLRRTGVTGAAVSFQDTLIVLKDALTADKVYMLREESVRPSESGWYVGLTGDYAAKQRGPEDYQALYTWQLLKIKPVLLALLALPLGCMAIIDNGEITDVVDKNDNRLW